MDRPFIGFVSSQALKACVGRPTVTKALAYDKGLPDLNLLLDEVDPSFLLVPVGSDEDAIAVIAKQLNGNNWQELAFLCHGSNGKLNIGKNVIDSESLVAREKELMSIDVQVISLYSCNIGNNLNLLQTLSNIMGSHVFASSTKVGAETKGGNWELDIHV